MLKTIAVIGTIAAMSGLCAAAGARPVETDRATVAIDRLVRQEMLGRGIPGLQLTIVRRGRIVYTGAYGRADESARVTRRTTFPINSISKAFAGVAAMQLVRAGTLDLDAALGAYLGDVPALWKGITIRQVLTHTSGLPEIVDDNVRLIDGAAPDAAWAKVQALPLRFAPGARFAYTQTNYVVIGKIIERLTGRSFSDFVRARQFDAAGMAGTGFGDTAGAKSTGAALYTYLRLLTEGTETVGVQLSKDLQPRHEAWPAELRPAGGIRSTSTDLAKWVIALQQHRLLDARGVELLWTAQALNDGSYGGFNSMMNGYALGWPSVRRAAHPAITPVGGERAAIFIYPEDDLTVIVLTNLMGAKPQAFIERIAALYVPGLGTVVR